MAKYSKTEIAESREYLAALLKSGDTVYTKVDHVSKSGMSRIISAYIIRDNTPTNISRHVAVAIGANFDSDRWGVKMGGCGMDITFALVYNLSRALFSEGHECTGSTGWTKTYRKAKNPRCGSNDHSNGDHVYRKGKMHRDGGYALHREYLG